VRAVAGHLVKSNVANSQNVLPLDGEGGAGSEKGGDPSIPPSGNGLDLQRNKTLGETQNIR
jgi:hypothetical protein